MRAAPALSPAVQRIACTAHVAGLVPLVSDVDDLGSFTVSMLPAFHAQPKDAEWVLAVDAKAQDYLMVCPRDATGEYPTLTDETEIRDALLALITAPDGDFQL